jgi:hypothetical protein
MKDTTHVTFKFVLLVAICGADWFIFVTPSSNELVYNFFVL